MAKVWSKVYEANYHKSLDHRSFYFKQVLPLAPLPPAPCLNFPVAHPCTSSYPFFSPSP